MKKIMHLSLYLLLAVFSRDIWAETGRYQIEVLVFSQNTPTSEKFNQVESKIQWPTALTELPAYQQSEMKALKDGAALMFKDADYQSISHFSWLQSTGAGNMLLPVHLQSDDGNLDGFIQFRTAQPFEINLDIELKSSSADRSGKRYLYRINEKRSIKLNEIQYFDHPKLGVIIKISGA